jgi:hypothetical protein
VAGCGRSGTHWLGGIMEQILGKGAGAFEPQDYAAISDVVVDSRLRRRIQPLKDNGHRIIHLVRNGHDVVRSLFAWYSRGRKVEGNLLFEQCCREWADALEMMAEFPHVRLEDLTQPGDKTNDVDHRMPPFAEWDEKRKLVFFNHCHHGMERYGYREDE